MVLRKSFLSLHNFWVQKCKNRVFEENKGFEGIFFFQIEVQVISNPSSRLELTEKHKTPEFLLMNDFNDFLKKIK